MGRSEFTEVRKRDRALGARSTQDLGHRPAFPDAIRIYGFQFYPYYYTLFLQFKRRPSLPAAANQVIQATLHRKARLRLSPRMDEHNAKLEILRLDAYFPTPVLLIGGLAVKFYYRGRTSKDLDIVCDWATLHSIEADAYPSKLYQSKFSQTDERPDIVYQNLNTGAIIYLGPKITERAPYEYIQFEHYFDDARPYEYDDTVCRNVLVPAPHYLAFSKIISAIARRGTPKGIQDLKDFTDLSNNESFSLNHFINYLDRQSAREHIENFLISLANDSNERTLLEASSIYRGMALLAPLDLKTTRGSANEEIHKGKLSDVYDIFLKAVETNSEGREIDEIRAIFHTGQVSVRTIGSLLEQSTLSAGSVRVLVRAPEYEDYFRHTASIRAIEDIQEYGFKYQLYSSPPMMHGILAKFKDGFEVFIYSFYRRLPNGRTKISDTGYLQVGPNSASFVPQFENWFSYHWGKSDDRIHTIVFDFDDTLADTGYTQIMAWCDALLELPDQRRELLRDEIVQALANGTLADIVKERFSSRQMANEIAHSMIKKTVSRDTLSALTSELHNSRLVKRLRRTLDAKLFPLVTETIDSLSSKYNLAIVSATDEKVIREFLRERGLMKYFSHVYGKFAPYEDWSQHIAIKAQNLIKMSSILGIPLARMTYVGDSNGDFLASKQVGVPFIEARLEKTGLGNATLIKSQENRSFFHEYSELPDALAKVEKRCDP